MIESEACRVPMAIGNRESIGLGEAPTAQLLRSFQKNGMKLQLG
jgi:hypothetical protein